MAIPGSVVAAGKLVTPGGAAGPLGGTGPPGPTVVSADAGNIAVLGSDSKIYVPDPTPQITSVRLRSYNSVGNPNFEVNQRVPSQTVVLSAGYANPWAQDRWNHQKNAATMTLTSQTLTSTAGIYVPGTLFRITQGVQNLTLTAQQASLAAGDYGLIQQTVEGPQFRELSYDVHSVSVLAYTNVAGGLKFAVNLRDPASTRSYSALCALTAANVWQLITLPNIPIFPSSGNFGTDPGVAGYLLSICYACGSTSLPPSNNTWNNGAFLGAIGMDNLGAKPVNSALLIGVVQHEPGPLCTTLIDKPFAQNLDECQRYYCKSYNYAVLAGSAGVYNGMIGNVTALSATNAYMSAPFPKRMAKIPIVGCYNTANGSGNQMRNSSTGVAYVAGTPMTVGESSLSQVTSNSMTAGMMFDLHYTADTGW